MHYSRLRAFHAVAVCGGFSKAAARLHLTQPAVSDQVRKLETHFDVLLFDRHHRNVRITELGSRLLEITRRLFEMEQEAVELLTESQALRVGHLNLAADAPSHVVHLISAFQRRYPGISVSLAIGNSDEVMSRLLDYRADLGVLADIADDARFQKFTLRSDPLVAFVGKDHAWADRAGISLRELASVPVVMRERGSLTRRVVEQQLHDAGVECRVMLDAEGQESVREAVAEGIGVGIASQAEFGFDTRLRMLELNDCRRRMTESLVCLSERAHLRTIDAFLTTARRKGDATEWH